MSELARLGRLASALREQGVDRLLVSAPVNVRYLCGYTGSNGLLLVDAGERAEHRFFTDFRYVTQSAEQVPEEIEREIAPGDLLEAAARALGEGGATGAQTLGFDDASLTVKQHARLRELLAQGWELVPCSGIVERLREVKDEQEIERIRAASELADQALSEVLEAGLVGTHRARGGNRAGAAHAPPRRAGTELPLDRRKRRARSAPTRRAARRRDRRGRARHDRLGRLPRWLLLGLHPHLCHRQALG